MAKTLRMFVGVGGLLISGAVQAQALMGIGGVCLNNDCRTPAQLRGEAFVDIPADGKGRVIEVPSDGIERYMTLASDKDGVPKVIQGLWWMDGNPLGDIAVTVANTHYNASTRTFYLPIGGEGNYSFRTSEGARSAYESDGKSNFLYEVQFNPDFTAAKLTAVTGVGDQRQVVPDELLYFTMRLVEDGHWVRESWVAGIRIADYQLRRLVRVDGRRDPAYADYLQFAGKYSYIIGHFD